MRRDTHRQRIYDAEEAAAGGTLLDEPLTWDDLVSLFHAAVQHPWWIACAVPEPVLESARSDSGRSSADGVRVRISPHDQSAATVAHELAHHLDIHTSCPGSDGPRSPHGPSFCAALLRTVEIMGGTSARGRLLAELHGRSVPIDVWRGHEPAAHTPLADTLSLAGPGRLRGAIPLPPAVRRSDSVAE
jgi:hypothetical protein